MTKDKCVEYVGEERRKHCDLVVEVRQKQADDSRRLDSIEGKLEELCQFINKIEGPYNAGLWAVRIMFGAFLLGIATAIIEYVRKHWN